MNVWTRFPFRGQGRTRHVHALAPKGEPHLKSFDELQKE